MVDSWVLFMKLYTIPIVIFSFAWEKVKWFAKKAKENWNNSERLNYAVYLFSVLTIVLSSLSYPLTNAMNQEQFNIRDLDINLQRFDLKREGLYLMEPFLKMGLVSMSTTSSPVQDTYRAYLIATYFEGNLSEEILKVFTLKELEEKIEWKEIDKWQTARKKGKEIIENRQKWVDRLFFVIIILQVLNSIIIYRIGRLSLQKK